MDASRILLCCGRAVVLVVGAFVFCIGAASAQVPSVIVRDVGAYNLPKGDCAFSIKTSPRGGFKQLSFPLGGGKANDIDDVTSIGFLNDRYLAFAISPMYGHAGIFLYGCVSKTINQIVSPQHKSLAYPAGTDYFLLQKLDNGIIYFYYAPDVDQINFANFEDNENLYEVISNGNGFKKSSSK